VACLDWLIVDLKDVDLSKVFTRFVGLSQFECNVAGCIGRASELFGGDACEFMSYRADAVASFRLAEGLEDVALFISRKRSNTRL
jgi:hypothetical protein